MIYVVKRGDTLSKIAEDNDMDLDDLLEMNPQIEDADSIFPKQKIRLTRGNDEGEQEIYTVQRGDNLTKIAKKFGIGLQDLLDANPQIEDPDFIQIGDEIFVPGTDS